MTEALHEIAHISHAELLTPKAEESLRFFVDVLGMEIEAREGQSVFLRGWGDYQRYCLKLTESDTSGMAHMALRPGAPRRSSAASPRSRRRGSGWGGARATSATARPIAAPTRTATSSSCSTRSSATARRPSSCPSLKNQPQRYVGRGAAIKRLDHINVLAADVRASRVFAQEQLGYRLHERIELDDGTESGAWLSASIAAHELIYTADAYGARGRLHHVAFWVDTREECLRAADLFLDNDVPIEAAPSKHAIAQGFFLYGLEPGGNRIEVTTGGYFVFDPEYEPVVWSEAERRKGQAWGVKTVESFHTYGTPPVAAPG